MTFEEERLPPRVRHPGGERARDQEAADDVDPDCGPVHHEVVGGRGEALWRGQPSPQRPVRVHGHVHLGVALHPPEQAAVRFRARLLDQLPLEEDAEEQRQQHDHDRPADELAECELPAEQQCHDDPELDHQVRGGKLECHRRGEVGALAEQRARQRDGGVRARRRGGAEAGREAQRARRIVGHQPPHLALRHHRLHRPRQREAEDQRPEDLPEHAEGEAERVEQLGHDVDLGEEHQLVRSARRRSAARFSGVRSIPGCRLETQTPARS